MVWNSFGLLRWKLRTKQVAGLQKLSNTPHPQKVKAQEKKSGKE